VNGVLDSLRKFQLAQAAAFRRAGDALGVSDTALITLNTVVGKADSGLSMKDLANEVGVSPAVLTGLVDRLEEKGWVSRHHSPTDRRSIVILSTVGEGSAVASVLHALDEPLRKVANAIDAGVADVVRTLAGEMESELRAFDADAAMMKGVGRAS
jgi:DNA-binding MarR family transcriptional regulator